MRKILPALILIFLSSESYAQFYIPPVARKILKHDTIHGMVLSDPYAWLKKKDDPDVINHLYAENAYADHIMKDSRILQKRLFDEMRGRMREEYTSLPYKVDSFYYYTRWEKDMNYPLNCRKKDSLTAKEEIFLDQNKLSKNYMYFSLEHISLSPDHSMVCYGIDNKGSHLLKLYFKDIKTDSVLEDQIPDVLDLVWASDNKTVFYVYPEPKSKRGYRIFRHVIGTSYLNDELIFEEKDATYNMALSLSSSKKFIFLNITKTKATEAWFIPADKPFEKFRLLEPRKLDLLYYPNHYEGDEFFIVTNLNAINFNIVQTPIVNPGVKNWREFISERKDGLLMNGTLFKDYIVLGYRENTVDRVRVLDRSTKEDYFLDFNDSLLTVNYGDVYEYEDNKIRFNYENMITPGKIYDYDLKTKEKTLLYEDTVAKSFSSEHYITERIFGTAPDGTKVPMTLAYKKGLKKDGSNPVYLSSYGSYGAGTTPAFSLQNYSYIDRGFIVAIAHIRGGNDLGTRWYLEGKLLNKKNTFLDFISCAEKLIKEGYTSNQKIVIEGGSAGGLLMGAVVNMRPDLFKAALVNVPFVDVINTMMDPTLPLTTFEYEEWGNPNDKVYFDYMSSYSPYENIKPQNYPMMLVRAGYNDAQVGYWEPAKWVARLRELKTDSNLLLLKTVMDGGHGGVSGRYEGLKQASFEMAFLMRALGIKEDYVEIRGRVVDVFNNPLSYVNVVVNGTSKGTTTNENGDFMITLRKDEPQEVVFQHIGFRKHLEKISMDTRSKAMNIVLKSEQVQLPQFTVSASGKDPAYGIIRQAMEKRKTHLEMVKSLSADIYIKSNVRLNKIPDKLPKFIDKKDLPDSNDLGLMFLSESVAKYYFKAPDHTKEQMLASKTGGIGQGYSWNRAAQVKFNFYENYVPIDYYSDRPFISPIASTAMIYYKFKLAGSFLEDGKVINKIQVIPRRKGDPVFHGYIFIIEDTWQIHSLDLLLTKDAQIEFVDTLFVKEDFVPVDDLWMPVSVNIKSEIAIFGFAATDLTVGFFTNYKLNPEFPSDFFSNEVFRIEKEAAKKDTSYWEDTRPFMLSHEENKYYTKTDSLDSIKLTPAYIDSVNKARNKLSVSDILITGYNYHDHANNSNYGINSMISALSFNTVEGMVLNLKPYYSLYKKETGEYKYISPRIRYGFSNRHLNATILAFKRFNQINYSSVTMEGGKNVFNYNENLFLPPLLNTSYTLLAEQNFYKLFEKVFLRFVHTKELINGFFYSTSVETGYRYRLSNTTDFTFIDHPDRAYTSNQPFPGADRSLQGGYIRTGINLTYRHNQKYEMHPEMKLILGSKYPEIYFNYKNGISLSGQNFAFHHIYAGTGDDLKLKTFGVFKYDAGVGTFIGRRNMSFVDYKHFNGNRTHFLTNLQQGSFMDQSRTRLQNFHTLDYYSSSTNATYLELHADYNMQGFILSKLPLLRKLQWYEVAGMNGIYSRNNDFTELYIGIDNIFKILRVDFATYYKKGTPIVPQFRIGLRFGL